MTRVRGGMPRLTGCDSIDPGAPLRKKAPRIKPHINCTINAPIMAAIRIAASLPREADNSSLRYHKN